MQRERGGNGRAIGKRERKRERGENNKTITLTHFTAILSLLSMNISLGVT